MRELFCAESGEKTIVCWASTKWQILQWRSRRDHSSGVHELQRKRVHGSDGRHWAAILCAHENCPSTEGNSARKSAESSIMHVRTIHRDHRRLIIASTVHERAGKDLYMQRQLRVRWCRAARGKGVPYIREHGESEELIYRSHCQHLHKTV